MSPDDLRDERNPVEDARELPLPEVGDELSFEREPDHGDPDADEPELEDVARPESFR